MTSIQSTPDTESLTLTFVAELEATPERVWQLWVDPRQLERWWGPPTWPATFVDHDPTPAGRSNYFMTGPEGEKSGGWWRFTSLTPPHALEFDDGFSGPDGQPDESMPSTHTLVTIDDIGNGTPKTRMTSVTTFASLSQLEQLLAMGMREGMTLAMGQIEAILAETQSDEANLSE